MTSWHHFYSTVTKNYQNLAQLCQCNSVRVHLYAYIPHWKVLKTFYIWSLQTWEAIKGGQQPKPCAIMASFPFDITQNFQNLTQLQRCHGVVVHLYAYIRHWMMCTCFYTCSLRMCEAIKRGLQPQPHHHGIISTRQSPIIAKIWPSFGSTV